MVNLIPLTLSLRSGKLRSAECTFHFFWRNSAGEHAGRVQPRMAVNAAQHKILHVLKTWWDFLWLHVTMYLMWPKTTLLLPVWHRDAKRLDTPARGSLCVWWEECPRISYIILKNTKNKNPSFGLFGTEALRYAGWRWMMRHCSNHCSSYYSNSKMTRGRFCWFKGLHLYFLTRFHFRKSII